MELSEDGEDEQQRPGHVGGHSSRRGVLSSKAGPGGISPAQQALVPKCQWSFLGHTGLTRHLPRTSASWHFGHEMHG